MDSEEFVESSSGRSLSASTTDSGIRPVFACTLHMQITMISLQAAIDNLSITQLDKDVLTLTHGVTMPLTNYSYNEGLEATLHIQNCVSIGRNYILPHFITEVFAFPTSVIM